MSDKIVNFYDKLGINKNSNLPATWDNHHIYIKISKYFFVFFN